MKGQVDDRHGMEINDLIYVFFFLNFNIDFRKE